MKSNPKINILLIVWSGLRVTPFSYYKEVVGQIMDMEKSYDTLPNFTAADCEFIFIYLCVNTYFLYQFYGHFLEF